MRKMLIRAVLVGCLAGTVPTGCSEYETQYFKNNVNEATADRVAKRYGSPHKLVRNEEGGMVWTYFDRGSGTSSYAGYATSRYCRAYVLTFDRDEILRDWKQEECRN